MAGTRPDARNLLQILPAGELGFTSAETLPGVVTLGLPELVSGRSRSTVPPLGGFGPGTFQSKTNPPEARMRSLDEHKFGWFSELQSDVARIVLASMTGEVVSALISHWL